MTEIDSVLCMKDRLWGPCSNLLSCLILSFSGILDRIELGIAREYGFLVCTGQCAKVCYNNRFFSRKPRLNERRTAACMFFYWIFWGGLISPKAFPLTISSVVTFHINGPFGSQSLPFILDIGTHIFLGSRHVKVSQALCCIWEREMLEFLFFHRTKHAVSG